MNRNTIIKLTVTLVSATLLTSCNDWFDIRLDTELVSEDFWKNKSDVESCVAACYRAMEERDVMERFIVWGEMRSDNVLAGYNTTNDISYILKANIDASNGYTNWGSFYSVINDCNTVLQNAPGVMGIDPNFKQGELRAYMAEAMTVRALSYFWLVRTFKDVPFITQPYTDDTRSFLVAQTDGDIIIDSLLTGLEAISGNDAKAVFSSTSNTKGRVTQKTLWTLMADMYLWRNNYDKCIEYCDKVLNTNTNPLHLETASVYNRNVYGEGNSTESIFELQFDAYTPNYVVNEMYGTMGGQTAYNNLSSLDFKKYPLFESTDLRQKDAFWGETSASIIPIKKYVAYRKESSSPSVVASDYVQNANTQHWILYRLADVYLMKAEALVERNGSGDLQKAIEMVGKTYDRANPSKGIGTLKLSDYNSQASMRELVFDERQREFLFEGKRYFDILRRIRREGNLQSTVSTYLLRKYVSQDQTTVLTRLNTLNALYLPINKDELKVNTLLVQNPFYKQTSDVEQK